MANTTQAATVLHVRHLSPDVKEMVLAPQVNPISYKPGQWISLQLPVGSSPPLVRAYSLAEPESVSGHLVLVFDRVPDGLGSGYLFGLSEGEELMVAGPYGRFVLPEPIPDGLVLIARYTGIVPIRCMLNHLCSSAYRGRIILSYTAPSESELIYHSEFIQLASYGKLLYLPHVSGADEGLHRPVVDWPMVRSLIPHIGEQKAFIPMISGIKAFVRPLRTYFAELGWERQQIHTESYD